MTLSNKFFFKKYKLVYKKNCQLKIKKKLTLFNKALSLKKDINYLSKKFSQYIQFFIKLSTKIYISYSTINNDDLRNFFFTVLFFCIMDKMHS